MQACAFCFWPLGALLLMCCFYSISTPMVAFVNFLCFECAAPLNHFAHVLPLSIFLRFAASAEAEVA